MTISNSTMASQFGPEHVLQPVDDGGGDVDREFDDPYPGICQLLELDRVFFRDKDNIVARRRDIVGAEMVVVGEHESVEGQAGGVEGVEEALRAGDGRHRED